MALLECDAGPSSFDLLPEKAGDRGVGICAEAGPMGCSRLAFFAWYAQGSVLVRSTFSARVFIFSGVTLEARGRCLRPLSLPMLSSRWDEVMAEETEREN